MADKIRVTVWNEFRHEQTVEKIRAVYPQGILSSFCSCRNSFHTVTRILSAINQTPLFRLKTYTEM